VNALSAQLGHPTHDPHGDPIPAADGEYVSHGGIPLMSIDENQMVRIVHVEDEPAELFAQIVAEGLHPGMRIWVIEKSQERIRFWANGDEHVLAPIVANNLSVVPELEEKVEDVFPCKRLSCLEPGQKAIVLGISPASRGSERRRLMDLGLLRGTTVQADFASPNGDPIAYRIRGATIALRHDQADLIYIDNIVEGDP
jgi:DtxR family Mn-dependent transcriptional regulator